MLLASTHSGRTKLRVKAPYMLSMQMAFSPWSSRSNLRSPLMVMTPSATAIFTSSLLDVRKLDLDEIFVPAFADVGERYPVFRRAFIPSDPVIRHVKRRKSTQRILYSAKWFPTQHSHTGFLLQWKQQPTIR
jgi:hypothetical protein